MTTGRNVALDSYFSLARDWSLT